MQIFELILLIIGFAYLAMVGLFTIGIARLNRKPSITGSFKMPISVVVALRNEEENIDNLLLSLTSQDYSKDLYEIVLVNDHSSDSTLEKIMQWANRTGNSTILELPKDLSGKKQAVALGVDKAKHDYIVLTDADCTHPTTWLKAISSQLEYSGSSMVIGPVMLSPSRSLFQKFQALEHSSLQASTLGACGIGLPFMASSANLAFSKGKLGFESKMLNMDRPSGDDVFLLHNAKIKFGSKVVSCVHSMGAMVYTKPADSIMHFFNQRARWASKATAYKDFTAIAVAVVVLLFNLSLVGLIASTFFAPPLWPFLVIGYGVKIFADFPLLLLYLKKYGEASLMMVFLPLQLVYPIYVVLAFIISTIGAFQWKGDKTNIS